MKRKVREKLDGKMMGVKREFNFLDNFDVNVETIDDDTKKLLMKKLCDLIHLLDILVSYAEKNASYVELFDYTEKWFNTEDED